MQETWIQSLGSGRSPGGGNCNAFQYSGFPGGSDGKAPAWDAGDPGSIPELGRSPGEGNGNPLHYSCPENSMDGGAWWATVHGVTKSRTRLSDFTFNFSILAWKLLWTEESDRLQFIGLQRAGRDGACMHPHGRGGFPSRGKELACNAEYTRWIPGLGRSSILA